MLDFDTIPEMLKAQPNWVVWKNTIRSGEPTKVPYCVDGSLAKANDPKTWCDFATARAAFERGNFTGLGYEFSTTDGLCGIDLDGCRDGKTGQVSEWAREVILAIDSYAEISPTKTGVKIFVVGSNPFDSGKKKALDLPKLDHKQPAVEIYDRGRYFAVTGWRLRGPAEPQPRQEQLVWFTKKFWPDQQRATVSDFYSGNAVVERARKYLAKVPPAVSGQGGHNQTFHAACVLILGFGLGTDEATNLLIEWNAQCVPPWSDRELKHKVDDAQKQTGERNYLRNIAPERWQTVNVPRYTADSSKREIRLTTLTDAASEYISRMKAGKGELIETGVADLDAAIGGGVERGELIILGARPSHGKSAVALQCCHNWTKQGRNCLIISEEMSALSLGKRTLLFTSDIPSEHWQHEPDALTHDLADYAAMRAECFIAESCGTCEVAIAEIEKAVAEHHVECVVVDYAQLLRSPGKSRYEQVTNTSIALRQTASKLGIVLVVLCQLSREVESRTKFVPQMSDIRDTGQLEQDADVIIFLVWLHRINSSKPPNEYQFYICKNRNRAINSSMVLARFEPSRQRVVEPRAKDMANYESSFDAFND